MNEIQEEAITQALEKWTLAVPTLEEEKILRDDDGDFSRVTFRAGYLAALALLPPEGETRGEPWRSIAQWVDSHQSVNGIEVLSSLLQALAEPAPSSEKALREALEWALQEICNDRVIGEDDTPEHFCGFIHWPDEGACDFHENYWNARALLASSPAPSRLDIFDGLDEPAPEAPNSRRLTSASRGSRSD